MELIERFRGSLLGLAACDALGTTVEFRPRGSFAPVETIVGGGPFRLNPGEWTDDTSMALCLAESLIEKAGFDPADQMRRYCRWYREGHLSSNGRCFDIGVTVSGALRRFEQTGEPYSGSTDPNSAGNGSVMRLAPVPLFYYGDPRLAVEMAAHSSRTTHGAAEAIDGCRYLAALIVGALRGASKEELLSDYFEPAEGLWAGVQLAPNIAEVASGSFRRREPPEIKGSGYVVRSLEAALWAFARSDDFSEGALLAVNLGDDADTTGAVYGQLAGAFYGERAIPEGWRALVAKRELIVSMAERLHASGAAAREPSSAASGTKPARPSAAPGAQVTPERIDELLAFLPAFEEQGRKFAVWEGGKKDERGVMTMPYPVYAEEVNRFFALASQRHWIDYDYLAKSPHEILADPERLSVADITQMKAVLTFCLRGERFCDGHWESLLVSGTLAAVLRRLKDLREGVVGRA